MEAPHLAAEVRGYVDGGFRPLSRLRRAAVIT